MTSKETTRSFAKAFCEGRAKDIEPLLHPDLRFHGPLHTFSDAASYMEALRKDPPPAGECAVVRTVGDSEAVSVLYDYTTERGTLRIAQYCMFEGPLIREIDLVFDARGFEPRNEDQR